MRIKNSMQNIFFGLSGQILSMALGFLVRTIFIYTLGVEYLGIEGLFTSILVMLSLANLGFDTAMIYSLYNPIAKKDTKKIQALINLYKHAYQLIGFVVLILGLIVLPFLPLLINGETNVDNIQLIYLIFLSNSVLSYYFVYNHSLIIADQKSYIISKIHSIFIILSNLTQIIILLSFGNYILVLISQILFRIIENAYISHKANKLYPFIKMKTHIRLSYEEKKAFFKNLYSMFLYKISGVVINGTDNVIISVYIGLTSVGIYSNYLLIISTINTLLSYIFFSLTASVGNLNAEENNEKKYHIFKIIFFMSFWIYGITSIFLWNLINPLISFWLHDDYLFNELIVLTIIINFYTTGMQNASTIFRETTGLFAVGKYRPIYAAIINLAASIILVQYIGISGVFLGTIISRGLTFFWYDPWVIYKNVFKIKSSLYFIRYILYALLVVGTSILVKGIISYLNVGSIIVGSIISLLAANLIFLICFNKSEEFEYLSDILKSSLNFDNIKKERYLKIIRSSKTNEKDL